MENLGLPLPQSEGVEGPGPGLRGAMGSNATNR